jgi:diguanylate cyclase (GGDEF)-like protein
MASHRLVRRGDPHSTPPAIDPGTLLASARADLARPDTSRHQLHEHLAQVLPAVEDLMQQVQRLSSQLAQARTCPVTHLLTRHAWTAAAQEVLAQGPGAVLLIDLDDFKPVNDRYGHKAGDVVLATIAQRLNDCCSAFGGVAGRLGGDELVAAVPATADLPQRVDQLHAALTAPVHHQGLRLRVGASIGLARMDEVASLSAALGLADRRMYQVKGRCRRGRRLARIAPLPCRLLRWLSGKELR